MGVPVLLHVEDDDATGYLFGLALKELALPAELHRVPDGDAALRFLRQTGEFTGAPRPDLILLDINLPGKSGFEVLSEIHESSALRRIPVIVFTSSSLVKEKNRVMGMGAKGFVTKPTTFDGFLTAVRSMCAGLGYWSTP